jgi:hypothetical protein
MNQVAVTTGSSEADRLLAMVNGTQSAPPETIKIPFLGVNYRPVDKLGREVRAGRFRITDTDGEYVYMKNPKLRILAEYFQFRAQDETGSLLNKTILMPTPYDKNPRDMAGTLRCGRPDSKSLKLLSEEDQQAWRKKSTFTRILRGVLSGVGEDANEKKRELQNYPFQLHCKGLNYMPFDKQVTRGLPPSKSVATVWLDLSTRLDGAVWMVDFAVDHNTDAPVDENIIETVKVFGQMMEQENAAIEQSYVKAFTENKGMDDALEATADYMDEDPSLHIG